MNVAFAQERLEATPCILSRLGEIRSTLLKTSDGTPLPVLGEIGAIPQRPFHWNEWEAMVSAGLADHLPDQRR